MKKDCFTANGKKTFVPVLMAVVLFALPCRGEEKTSARAGFRQEILSTLRYRVELLDRLTADYEKQYGNGSLDGQSVMRAQTALYTAELLLMKAEAGLPAEPGIAASAISLYAARALAKDMQQRSKGGNLSYSLLLKAELDAAEARLKYLNQLDQCSRPEFIENMWKKLPVYDPAKRLDRKLLKELFEAEIRSRQRR